MADRITATRPSAPRTNVLRFQGDAYLGNAFHLRADARAGVSADKTVEDKTEEKDEAFVASAVKGFFEEASAVTAPGAAHEEKLEQDNDANPLDGFRETL